MAEQNLDYQTLIQCADDLTQLIQHNVISMSSKLFAKGLVAKDVHDSVLSVDGASNQSKAAKLLSCVLDKIKQSADQYRDFTDVLGEDSYFDNIMLKITNVRETLSQDGTVENEERKLVAAIDSKMEIQEVKDKEEVGKQIKRLEKIFLSLKKTLLKELKANKKITAEELLESLSILPTELQTEYGTYIEEKLQELQTVSKIFQQLSLHITFLDYALLQHLIDEFGSEQLKQDMSAYDGEIQVFLDETTITQLQDHLPGRQELPPHFNKLQMVIDKDPGKCSLRMVNDLRKRFCNETQLSEIVFVLIGIGKANSFILIFMVPSVLGSKMVESISAVDDSFYQREGIISISLNQQQLYLSLVLREKKAECEKRLLVLCASNTGDIQEFTYILSQPGVDPNIRDQEGRTPLVLASNNGRNEVIHLLLDHGANIDFPNTSENGDSPLIGASRHGHVATCQLLIDRGATIEFRHKKGGTAVMVASQSGHIEVVQLLLDYEAEINLQSEDGFTALHNASFYGHKEVVELILDRVDDVDKTDKEGTTALQLASENGHEEIVKLLLERGADVDKTENKYGITSLALAARKGREQVVDVLLKAGANPDIQDKEYGMTALAWAAFNGYVQVVDMLLKAGANPDLQDKMIGGTALYHAAGNGDAEIVSMLLDGGADMEVKAENGWTAYVFASSKSHLEVCQLLEQYGYETIPLQSTLHDDDGTNLNLQRDTLEHVSDTPTVAEHQENCNTSKEQ